MTLSFYCPKKDCTKVTLWDPLCSHLLFNPSSRLHKKYEDVTIRAYLDDIFAVGEVDRVLCTWTDLKSSLVNIGLRVCERKCELYSTTRVQSLYL